MKQSRVAYDNLQLWMDTYGSLADEIVIQVATC